MSDDAVTFSGRSANATEAVAGRRGIDSRQPVRPPALFPSSQIPLLEDLPAGPLAQRFAKFHAKNPHIYHKLVGMARALVARGRTRIGMKMLFEALRYETLLSANDPSGFKLNNNFTAFYSRLICQNEPELRGLFELRESVADTYTESAA